MQWPTKTIGELFEIGSGKTMSAKARNGAKRTPFLRTANVLWDEIDLTTVDEMEISDDELQSKSLRPGDLLVCEGGDIGRSAVWAGQREVMSFQNHLHRLRPKTDLTCSRFYVYYLQCGFTQLGIFEGAGNKTTIPNLSKNRLAALAVPVPARQDQEAIVRILSTVRQGVDTHRSAVERATELMAACMTRLFSRGLRGEAQKDSEVGPVPDSWRVEPLAAHFAVCSGGTPSRGCPQYWEAGEVPWVKTTEVNYCVIRDTEERISSLGLAESAAKLLPAGTVLMGTSRNLPPPCSP